MSFVVPTIAYRGYYDPQEYENNSADYQVKVKLIPSVYRPKFQIGDRVVIVGSCDDRCKPGLHHSGCSAKIRFYKGRWGVVKKVKNVQMMRSGYMDPENNYKEVYHTKADCTLYTVWLYGTSSMGKDVYLDVSEANMKNNDKKTF